MFELSLQTSLTTFYSRGTSSAAILLVENLNKYLFVRKLDNNSISGSAFKNLTE